MNNYRLLNVYCEIFGTSSYGEGRTSLRVRLRHMNECRIFHNIGIKHVFPCINVCQVPREMLKTEAVGRGFPHLPRDLANVNVLENNDRSLLFHKLNDTNI